MDGAFFVGGSNQVESCAVAGSRAVVLVIPRKMCRIIGGYWLCRAAIAISLNAIESCLPLIDL